MDDAVETYRETRRKLAECIRSLSGVRWELTEGDWELARMESGVHRKKTKRLIGDRRGLSKSLPGELAEGIGSLSGWYKGVHRKKIETHRKIIKGSRKACRESVAGDDWTTQADGYTAHTLFSGWLSMVVSSAPVVVPPVPEFFG
ncbi:hypothetical protein GW17_00016107 [Ensete ventricosum]|nr:hypothetical protein GW17_00016107 [Ensete ventricosum]